MPIEQGKGVSVEVSISVIEGDNYGFVQRPLRLHATDRIGQSYRFVPVLVKKLHVLREDLRAGNRLKIGMYSPLRVSGDAVIHKDRHSAGAYRHQPAGRMGGVQSEKTIGSELSHGFPISRALLSGGAADRHETSPQRIHNLGLLEICQLRVHGQGENFG